MVYAIIESGGKQYKVVEGSPIEVDLLSEEAGKKVKIEKVLLIADESGVQVGTPILNGVTVETTVMDHFKGPKITIFKYRAKERYRIKTGHRQQFTRLMVDSIMYPGKPKKTKKEEQVSGKEEPVSEKVKSIAKKPVAKPKLAPDKKPSRKK